MSVARKRVGWGKVERASDNVMSKCHLVTSFHLVWSWSLQLGGQGLIKQPRTKGFNFSSTLFSPARHVEEPQPLWVSSQILIRRHLKCYLDFNYFQSRLQTPIKLKVNSLTALLWEQACNNAPVRRSPPLINPGINHTLPVPRGERDESGGELEIMLMSRQVNPPLWPFQKLLILLVVTGLEIITSSNPCNTAWPAVGPGQFEDGEAGWRVEVGKEWARGGRGESQITRPCLLQLDEWCPAHFSRGL